VASIKEIICLCMTMEDTFEIRSCIPVLISANDMIPISTKLISIHSAVNKGIHTGGSSSFNPSTPECDSDVCMLSCMSCGVSEQCREFAVTERSDVKEEA